MSDSSIMSVREMIDSAFGESDVNVVNFKLIQAILYLLARELRVLERQIGVEIGFSPETSSSTLSVSEVKMHATIPKKQKKRKIPTPAQGGGRSLNILGQILSSTPKIISIKKGDPEGGKGGFKGRVEDDDEDPHADLGKPSSKSNKRETEKSPSDKSSADKSLEKPSTEIIGFDKKSENKSSFKKILIEKSSDGKLGTNKVHDDDPVTTNIKDDKKSPEKKSDGKLSSEKKTSGKSTNQSDRRYDDDDRSISDNEPSSDKKNKEISTLDTLSPGKTLVDKKSASKSSSGKRFHDDDSSASSEPSSQRSTAEQKSSHKARAGKSSSEHPPRDTQSPEKHSTKASADESKSEKHSTKIFNKSGRVADDILSSTSEESKRKNYYKLLEKIEEDRERVLRVIHQRADSHEENVSSPSPMASLESTEVKYEKLLIVERVPTEDAKGAGKRGSKSDIGGRTPRLSVVTQEQFAKLVKAVMDLETKFGPIGVPGFPENIKLMEDLRKGASLTDAMAALQLSARLEAAEQALQRMMSLVTDLASRAPEHTGTLSKTGTDGVAGVESKPGAGERVGTKDMEGGGWKAERDGTRDMSIKRGESDTRILFEEPDTVSQAGAMSIKSGVSRKSFKERPESGIDGPSASHTNISMVMSVAPSERHDDDFQSIDPTKRNNYITYDQLDTAMQELYDDFYKTVNSLTRKSNANSDNAVKIANKIEAKIEEILNLGNRMNRLENAVSEYVEQINTLDTGMSSQMTNYQEQLTQMQHDLESGLENMAEALATQGGDTEAVTELNAHFTTLQYDFDRTKVMQKELDEVQQALWVDLQELWKEIELLRESKSDRDEVADALRDKAGIGVLNGLVTLYQFEAVRGDFEKRVSNAYDKFNNQEVIWQKAIDDLLREINEKAEITQVESLSEDVNKNMNMLRGRIDYMLDLLGEPRAAALSRRLFRDTECLSCSTPAHMVLDEPDLVPPLPAMPARPPALGEEAPPKSKNAGDGDHGLCYSGLPIPHPRDPRARFCSRYCGGAHTVCDKSPRQQLASININQLVRETTAGVGTDGKTYLLEQSHVKKPCLPCNATPKLSTVRIPCHDKGKPQTQQIIYKSFAGMSAATGDSGFSKPTILEVVPLPQPPEDNSYNTLTAQAVDVDV